MAYAVPQDLVSYYDASVVADLASDTEMPESDLNSSRIVLKLLAFASGRINSAASVAARYSAEDLALLTGDDKEVLTELCCTLAMGKLLGRRPGSQHAEAYQEHIEAAEEFLDRLRKGERVFAFEENVEAGLPLVDGPTTVDYTRLNLIPDRIRHYYPSRGSTIPRGRQYGG